jgi:hypothetical protein
LESPIRYIAVSTWPAPVRWVLAYVFLNVPFWWWSQHYFVSRPWFNVELALPVLLASYSLPVAYLVLASTWFIDGLVGQSATFYFSSPVEFLRSAQFLSNLSWREYLTWERAEVTAPFLAAAWALPRLIVRGMKMRWLVLLLPVLLAVVDVFNGSSMASERAMRRVDVNLAGSPTVTLTVRALAERNALPLVELPASDSSRAMVDVRAWARTHPDRSVVFVLAESFGVLRQVSVRDWLFRQLWGYELSGRYQLLGGQVPFHGATTSGELRELCGLAGSYRKISGSAERLRCLPHDLAEQGWSTTGLHGFSQAMFMRSLWWPEVGLQRSLFAEELSTDDSARCGGAFAGLCDADVLARGFEIARAPRQFVYVLTLNSHLPVKSQDLVPELAQLCDRTGLQDSVCQLNDVLGRMLRAVHQGLMAAPTGNLPLVVLVGDHAPPFADREIRLQFSQTHVQAYVLMPRN